MSISLHHLASGKCEKVDMCISLVCQQMWTFMTYSAMMLIVINCDINGSDLKVFV